MCLLGAAGMATVQLAGCSPALPVFKSEVKNKQTFVPLDIFEKSSLQIVRPRDMFYDIAVERKADNTYTALLLLCTHQDNQLTVTSNGYSCALHGSNFDKNGQVLKGPAAEPLKHFTTTVSGSNLVIHI